MTNHFNDIQYADAILIIGANPAENHPISTKWILKAKQNGATIIHVDPRYTRTSQLAHLYAPLRSGTDIAFIGGLVNYALQNDLIHKEYVAQYTNASFLVNEEYSFHDGLFSGYDEKTRSYEISSWAFEKDENGKIVKDETLTHPRCVYQLLKAHYARYDIDTVCAVTGTPKEAYLKVIEAFLNTHHPDKVGTILYAMGATQHTTGTGNVRIYAILQLLLGNMGRPGGGLNALRGECNVQGSTDFGLLYHSLPGYLNAPTSSSKHATLANYIANETPPGGYWSNKPKFIVSLLKAFYGPNATQANDFAYDYLPKYKVGKNYSHIALFEAMYRGEIKGLFTFGQNPAVGGPNSNKELAALSKLEWLVVTDLFETETAAFWSEEAGQNPDDIQTEVFLLPAAGPYEKEGSVTNSGRWMQYRWKAISPKHEAKSDMEIINQLALRLKSLYQNETTPQAKPIQALHWDYGEPYPDQHKVLREINGYDTQTGRPVENFGALAADGSTACGNWIYSGFYPQEGQNLAQRRDNRDTGMSNFLNWAYAWPLNRRILYNRAAADPHGKPWDEKKAIIWWDNMTKQWTGYDVPDFPATLPPQKEGGTAPFIMLPEGLGALFAPLKDGPLPEHYEPYESPVPNAFSSVQFNPTIEIWDEEMNRRGSKEQFPIVATTYRLGEHYQSGAMTRNQSWLSELAPHAFVELSEELAQELGIKNKDQVIVESARGTFRAYALVTGRFKPFKIRGEIIHHIGTYWHWGYKGITTGDMANYLTAHVGDANTTIPEYKAFLCRVRRA